MPSSLRVSQAEVAPALRRRLDATIVQPILDIPMGLNHLQQTFGIGLVHSRASYTVDSPMGCLFDEFRAPLNFGDPLNIEPV